MTAKKECIVSGMRPTGPLHLGHHFGVLANWLTMQEQHDCLFFVADWHALTTEYAEPKKVKGFVPGLVLDWVAAGLDPEKCVIFQQSQVKEHAELHLLLSMLTPVSWLERNPTYKEMKHELVDRDLSTFGFLGYPVLQAADIIMYKAYGVPVGVDQLPHVELTREIARRFNFLYREIFPVPEPLLTTVPKLLGTDGRKMSKSYDNAIYLSERGKELRRKIESMFTDPRRQRKSDPGRPEVCNVFAFHNIYSPPAEIAQIDEDCRRAAIGCVQCKKRLADRIEEGLRPIHDRQDYYRSNIREVHDIIADGNERARRVARATMAEVRDAIRI